MSPRWFNLEPIFWKLWPYLFFWTAHNFANGPHFSLAYSSSQSQDTPDSLPPKKAVLGRFFGKKKVFLAKRSTFTYSMSYRFWKLLVQRLIYAINRVFWNILRGVRLLLTRWNRIVHTIWHYVISQPLRGHTSSPHLLSFSSFGTLLVI